MKATRPDEASREFLGSLQATLLLGVGPSFQYRLILSNSNLQGLLLLEPGAAGNCTMVHGDHLG